MRIGHFLKSHQTTGPANGNASKLVQRVPFFIYSILNVRCKTCPPYNFFPYCATIFEKFLSPNGPPLILLEYSLVISGVKRYIRTFDVISELYFAQGPRMEKYCKTSNPFSKSSKQINAL